MKYLKKVLVLLHFESCQNCNEHCQSCRKNPANERVLRTGEPCTCEYLSLLQSFYRTLQYIKAILQYIKYTLSIHSSKLLVYFSHVRLFQIFFLSLADS